MLMRLYHKQSQIRAKPEKLFFLSISFVHGQIEQARCKTLSVWRPIYIQQWLHQQNILKWGTCSATNATTMLQTKRHKKAMLLKLRNNYTTSTQVTLSKLDMHNCLHNFSFSFVFCTIWFSTSLLLCCFSKRMWPTWKIWV